MEVTIQLQQNILRQLLGQSTIPGHPPSQRENHRLVLVHELLEVRLPGLLSPVQGLSHALLLSNPQNFSWRDAEPYAFFEKDVSDTTNMGCLGVIFKMCFLRNPESAPHMTIVTIST
jgi:hypothetical protein